MGSALPDGDETYWFAPALNNPASFRAAAAYQQRCAGCDRNLWGLLDDQWHAHHVLERRHLPAGAPEYHPDNAVALCTPNGLMSGCHATHHDRKQIVRTTRLPVDALLFVLYWKGALPGLEYLARYYDGNGDTRLADLAERALTIPPGDLIALRIAVGERQALV